MSNSSSKDVCKYVYEKSVMYMELIGMLTSDCDICYVRTPESLQRLANKAKKTPHLVMLGWLHKARS